MIARTFFGPIERTFADVVQMLSTLYNRHHYCMFKSLQQLFCLNKTLTNFRKTSKSFECLFGLFL